MLVVDSGGANMVFCTSCVRMGMHRTAGGVLPSIRIGQKELHVRFGKFIACHNACGKVWTSYKTKMPASEA